MEEKSYSPHLTPIRPTYRPPTHHRARPVYVFNGPELTALQSLLAESNGLNPIPREFYQAQAHEFLQSHKVMVEVTPASVAKVALAIKRKRQHLLPHAILQAHMPEYVTESGEVIPTLLEKATELIQALFPKGKLRPQTVAEEVTFRPGTPVTQEHLEALKALPEEIEGEVAHHPFIEITLRIKDWTKEPTAPRTSRKRSGKELLSHTSPTEKNGP
jgi:hypothetical protein